MLEKQLRWLASMQKKYPVLIVLIILTLSLFLDYYALRIETDSSFEVMYRDDSDTVRLNNLVANEFGSTDALYVLVIVDQDITEVLEEV